MKEIITQYVKENRQRDAVPNIYVELEQLILLPAPISRESNLTR